MPPRLPVTSTINSMAIKSQSKNLMSYQYKNFITCKTGIDEEHEDENEVRAPAVAVTAG